MPDAQTQTVAHYYYHYDGRGNVSQMTDTSQNVVASYSYDAYGHTGISGLLANANPYRYQTKAQHSASGLYDYGYRFYSPNLGRWLNRDPLRENGGLNLYGFSANNPLSFVDPYGLACGRLIGGIIGGILGGLLLGGLPGSAIGTGVGSLIGSLIDGEIPEDSIKNGLIDGGMDFLGGKLFEGLGKLAGRIPIGKVAEKFECFVAGTEVTMGNGELKPIEQIKVGDHVLSRDETTGKTEVKEVERATVRQVITTIVLSFDNGERIETTSEHPFYVEGRGFVAAKELGVGTSIVTRAGPSAKVLSNTEKAQPNTVYNLTVAGFHTYFVGKNAFWVHRSYPKTSCDEFCSHFEGHKHPIIMDC